MRRPAVRRPLTAAVTTALSVLLGVLLLTLAAQLYYSRLPVPAPNDVTWGVTFSRLQADELGLDWRETYLAVLHDLKPASIRLVAYWNRIERRRGEFDTADLDWQFTEAEKAGIPVVLVIGEKVPRWPEYHVPRWVELGDREVRERELEAYLTRVVEHYSSRPGLAAWQVENEPLHSFGPRASADRSLLVSEIGLVRRLDPGRPVLLTDSGELGRWWDVAGLGDQFGFTLYRRVSDPTIGTFTIPLTPEFYVAKARLTRLLTRRPNQVYLSSELSAEPWGRSAIESLTPEQQTALFSPSDFDEVVRFAPRTRVTTFYLWGCEWWYLRKLAGDTRYWEKARTTIASGRRASIPLRSR